MSRPRDYYAVLDIPRGASQEEIKKAYRRMAMRYHPDRAQDDPDAEERFKDASEAYTVLSDERKRREYDLHGHIGGGDGPVTFDPAKIQEVLGDLFSDIFGRKRRSEREQERGRDLRYRLTITLGEAAFGAEREIRVPRRIGCRTCRGTGARPGSQPDTCKSCGGSGELKVKQGFFAVRRECSYCHGQGSIVRDPCRDCFGSGMAEVDQVLTVRVPGGVSAGQRLRVAGRGDEGQRGAEAGDLYVEVSVEEHPLLRREGAHVRCEVPVTAAEAALGCEVDIPTLRGRVRMRIPPGSQPGRVFRLTGKGLQPLGRSAPGDQLVTVSIESAAQLLPRQRELYQALLEAEEAAHMPRRRAFREQVAALTAAPRD